MDSLNTDNLKVGLSEESELKGIKEDSVENAVTQVTDVTVSIDSIPTSETEKENEISIEPMDTSFEALEANRYEDVEMPTLDHEPPEERSEDVEMPKLDQEPPEEMTSNTSIDNNIEVKGFHIDQQQFEVGESQSDENNTHESCGNKIAQEANFEKFVISEIRTVDTTEKETISEEEKQDSNIEVCNFEGSVDNIGIKNDQESLDRSESAFQKLSNLGVIAAEKTIEESKESLLQKLASRGAISITPSSGGTGNSSSSSLSIRSSALPIQKSGTKSAVIKQKSKKIKIDPGKSSDIDKDFDSLINFLSANNTEKDESESNQLENDTSCTEILKPEVDNVSEPCLEQKKDELNGVVQETINNDEMVVHEMDTESHDGSKISHSSDQAEDDEQILITSSEPKNAVEEGSAEILLHSKNVFYNKVQEFNRDMR